MKTLVLNVSDKAYKKLKKAADELYAELYDGKDMEHALERVLEAELEQAEPFIEMMNWDDF